MAQDDKLEFKLPSESIAIVGLGGVGAIVARYLSLFLGHQDSAVRLKLIDGDEYEDDNTDRQIFDTYGNKAEVQAAELLNLNALSKGDVTILPIPQFVTEENIDRLIVDGDLVLMCVDHHGVRNCIAKHCESDSIRNIMLFSGGNEAIDPPKENGTAGNVQAYLKQAGHARTITLGTYHPEIKNASIKDATFGADGCGNVVKSAPQILFANLAVASAMLNMLFAFGCGKLSYQEARFDILAARMLPYFPIDNIGVER